MATGMRPGRPPKSNATKIAEGNRGKRKLPTSISRPENYSEEAPKAPEGLSAEGIATWYYIWASSNDIDPKQDMLTVRQLCFLVDELEFMRKALSIGSVNGGVDRFIKVGVNGAQQPHPYVAQIKDARVMINALSSALLLTPSDRIRANITKDEANNIGSILDDVMRKRAEREAANESSTN